MPYGIKDGETVWFTIDHLKPRSQGGSHSYDNVRACCLPCNQDKANLPAVISEGKDVPSNYEIKILKRFYNKKLDEDLPPWEPYYGF